jgi:hypothetical protein
MTNPHATRIIAGAESKFKWLGTNVLTPEGKPFGGSSWIDVREYPLRGNNGDDGTHQRAPGSLSPALTHPGCFVAVLRVGLFGVCTLATPNLSFPDADVTFAPIIACTLFNHRPRSCNAHTHFCWSAPPPCSRQGRGQSSVGGAQGGRHHRCHPHFLAAGQGTRHQGPGD